MSSVGINKKERQVHYLSLNYLIFSNLLIIFLKVSVERQYLSERSCIVAPFRYSRTISVLRCLNSERVPFFSPHALRFFF